MPYLRCRVEEAQQERLVRSSREVGGQEVGCQNNADPLCIADFDCSLGCFVCTTFLAKEVHGLPKIETAELYQDGEEYISNEWHLDSGANILVVPHGDSCIINIHEGKKVPLHSTTGTVLAPYATIQTPIGRLKGLVVAGAPRLVPTDYFREFNKLGRSVRSVHDLEGNSYAVKRGMAGTLVLDLQDSNQQSQGFAAQSYAAVSSEEHRTSSRDGWEETPTSWVRTHKVSRCLLYLPNGADDGPSLEDLTGERFTEAQSIGSSSTWVVEDSWTGCARQTCRRPIEAEGKRWIGTTTFYKIITETIVEPDMEPDSVGNLEVARKLDFKAFFIAFRGKIKQQFEERHISHTKCPCEYCQVGKAVQAARRKGSVPKPTGIMEVIVCDLCTHLPLSYDGFTVIAVFKDLASGLTWAFPIKSKLPILVKRCLVEVVCELIELRRSLGLSDTPLMWRLHGDQGGEFTAEIIQAYITERHGSWAPCPTDRHIAPIEAAIRAVVDQMRTCLEASGLPTKYWSDAILHGSKNKRLLVAEYSALLSSNGSLTTRRPFGLLCFAPIALKSKKVPKSSPRAVPCAYLGMFGRRGVKLLYRESSLVDPAPPVTHKSAGLAPIIKESSLHVTTFEEGTTGEAVKYTPPDEFGKPRMAFKRTYRDLERFMISGDAVDRLGYDGMTPEEMEQWLKENPTQRSGKQQGLHDVESGCAKCRGSHRAHDRSDMTCIYGGISKNSDQERAIARLLNTDSSAAWLLSAQYKRENVQQIRMRNGTVNIPPSGSKLTSAEKLQVKANKKSLDKALGGDMAAWSIWRNPDALSNPNLCRTAYAALGQGGATDPTQPDILNSGVRFVDGVVSVSNTGELIYSARLAAGPEPVSLEHIVAALRVSYSAASVQCLDRTTQLLTQPQAQSDARLRDIDLTESCLGDRGAKALTNYKVAVDLLGHAEFSDTWTKEYAEWQVNGPLLHESVAFRTMAFEGVEHQRRHRVESLSQYVAFVTKKMTSEQKRSTRGLAAMKDEMTKLVNQDIVLPPINGKEVKNKRAQKCGMAMLAFIKFAEKEESKHVYKGRAVLLGDKLTYVWNNQVIGKEGHWWEKLASTPATLEECRMVDCYAVIAGYTVEVLDFESAYLQAEWPTYTEAETYIQIPKDLQEFLPKALQPLPGNDYPLWKLFKAGYGHPASGHLWAQVLTEWLIRNLWINVGRTGKGCMFCKGVMMVVVYVDDMKACGPKDMLAKFWNSISGENGAFKWKEPPQTVSEFLGATYERKTELRDNVMCDVIHVGLTDYIQTVVKEYEKERGITVKCRKVCSTLCLRIDPRKKVVTIPKREHQKIIGCCLWIMRVNRPDISEAVSGLGARVACWTQECTEQMDILVGYLKLTAQVRLEFCWPVHMQGANGAHMAAELYCDADHRGSEKSQSSFVSWIRPIGSTVGGCLLHWLSKKQSITATSAADAEIIATYVAFKEGSHPLMVILAAFGRKTSEFTILVDNNTAQGNMDKHASDVCEMKLKAVNSKAGFLYDMYDLGVYQADHVDSDLNKSDGGTKKPKSVGMQKYWRSQVNLQLPFNAEEAERRAAYMQTNGPPPSKGVLNGEIIDPEDADEDIVVENYYPKKAKDPAPPVTKPSKLPTAAVAAAAVVNGDI